MRKLIISLNIVCLFIIIGPQYDLGLFDKINNAALVILTNISYSIIAALIFESILHYIPHLEDRKKFRIIIKSQTKELENTLRHIKTIINPFNLDTNNPTKVKYITTKKIF